MSRGQLKPLRSLTPQPRAPHIAPFDQVAPFAPGVNCWMRWLTLSATYRLPLLSNVIPAGVPVRWGGVTGDGRELVEVVLLVGGDVDVAGGVGGGIAGQRRLAVQHRHRDGAFQRARRRVDGDLVGRVLADQDDVAAGRVLARGDAERGGKAGPGRTDCVAVGRVQHLDAVVAGVSDVEVA